MQDKLLRSGRCSFREVIEEREKRQYNNLQKMSIFLPQFLPQIALTTIFTILHLNVKLQGIV